jgi:hypothetical protein
MNIAPCRTLFALGRVAVTGIHLVVPLSMLAYGPMGHETVGAIADELLAGTAAEMHVRDLLHGLSLAQVANWADRVKHPPFDSEMQQFVDANPHHFSYHYSDVPMQEVHYVAGTAGTSPEDIVQVTRECIAVLQGNATPATNPHGFNPRVALMLLVHLVGDLHQPLHVGAAYFNSKDRFVDPNAVHQGVSADEGGNWLRYSGQALHAFWDGKAVDLAMHRAAAPSPQAFAVRILQNSPIVPQTPGVPVDWPQHWADEMLPLAAHAHQGLKVGRRHIVNDAHGSHPEWTVTAPPGYEKWARDTARERLTAAGFRLAQTLEAIWP